MRNGSTSVLRCSCRIDEFDSHGRVRGSGGRVDGVGTEAASTGAGDRDEGRSRSRGRGVVLFELLLERELTPGQDLQDRAELVLGVVDSTTDGLPDLGEDGLDSGASLDISDWDKKDSDQLRATPSSQSDRDSLLTSWTSEGRVAYLVSSTP